MITAKPFDISKREVWEAFKKVKANQGAAGVDGQSIAEFEADLADNLYKLWNRLSSGSYLPPPVRRVDIPKANGGTRSLGIPTVADRDCSGGRPSVSGALAGADLPRGLLWIPSRPIGDRCRRTARQRCWRSPGSSISTSKPSSTRSITSCCSRRSANIRTVRWVLLYVERWLKAPMQTAEGGIEPRTMGTPQGGVISPLLANLFLHYAFDAWMGRELPHVPFERYADDIICHVRTRGEAVAVLDKLKARFATAGWRSSSEDEDRLLPGYQPARQRPSGHIVRLPRLHVPSEAGEMAQWQIRRLVPAGRKHTRTEVHSQGSPRLGPAAPQRQKPE